MMTLGRNASMFFPDVVKNVVVDNIELKKLVYMYIVKYSEENQDLALLSINSLQKDLAPSMPPRVRASALRALASIRVPIVVTVLVHSISSNLNDHSPYVRKAAAAAIPKVYDLDPDQQATCIDLISKMLGDGDPDVLGHALFAFDYVCPRNFELLHPHYRKLCHLMADFDQWGQMIAIKVLGAYARQHFAKPAGYVDILQFDPDSPEKNIYAVLGTEGAASVPGLVEAALAAGVPELVGKTEAAANNERGSAAGDVSKSATSVSQLASLNAASVAKVSQPQTILAKYAHDGSQPFFDDDDDAVSSDDITDSDFSSDSDSDDLSSDSSEQSDDRSNRAHRKKRKEARKAKRAAAKAKRKAAKQKKEQAKQQQQQPNLMPFDVLGVSSPNSAPSTTVPSLANVLGAPAPQTPTPSSSVAQAFATPTSANVAESAATTPSKSTGLEPDLALLLRSSALMLRTQSAGVVVAIAGLYQSLAPLSYLFPCAKALVHVARAGRAIAYPVYATINTLASHVPELFTQFYTDFFVNPTDPGYIKALKVDTLSYLSTPKNFKTILQELQVYLGFADKTFVTRVVSAMTRVASKYPVAVAPCVQVLMSLIASSNDDVVARAVLAIRVLLQRVPDEALPANLIEELARAVELVKAPAARAALVSVVARYHARIPDLAPEVLRVLARDFINEDTEVKVQILNLACILFLINQQKLAPLFKYVMDLCKYDVSFDLRDRARLLRALFFKKRKESVAASPSTGGSDAVVDNTEVKEMLKQVLQIQNPPAVLPQQFHERDTLQIGTLSHLVKKPIEGYSPLPQFPAASTPASVRDKPAPKPAAPTHPTGKAAATASGASASKTTSDPLAGFYSESGDDSDTESSSESGSSDAESDDDGYTRAQAKTSTAGFGAFGAFGAFGGFGVPETSTPPATPATPGGFGAFGAFGAFGLPAQPEQTASSSQPVMPSFGDFGAFGSFAAMMSPPNIQIPTASSPAATKPEDDPFASAVGDVSSALQPGEGFSDLVARPSPSLANMDLSSLASPPSSSALGKFEGNLGGFGFSNLGSDAGSSFDIFSQKR